MKRILSVILSLALLASLLIVPMVTQATTSDPVADLKAAVTGLEEKGTEIQVPWGTYGYNASSQLKSFKGNSLPSTDVNNYGSYTMTLNKAAFDTYLSDCPNGDVFWLGARDYLLKFSHDAEDVADATFNVGYYNTTLKTVSFYLSTNKAIKIRASFHNKPAAWTDVPAGTNQLYTFNISDFGLTSLTGAQARLFVIAVDVVDATVPEDIEVKIGSLSYKTANNANKDGAAFTAKYASATALTGEMIADAEAINTSNTVASTVTALEAAIASAKDAFMINDANTVELLKAEAAILTEREVLLTPEHARPVGGTMGYMENYVTSLSSNLTDNEKEFLKGEYAISVTNGYDFLMLAKPGAESSEVGIEFKPQDYKSIKWYCINKGNTASVDLNRFQPFGESTTYITAQDVTRIWSGKNEIDLLNNASIQANKDKIFERFQVGIKSDMPGQLIVGSIIGEKYFDTEAIDALNSKAEVMAYYAQNIAGKAYNNVEAITETATLIGVPPVIAGATEGAKYCGSVELTITDTDLVSVTLTDGGANVIGSMNGDKLLISTNGAYKVVATDAKGNTATLNITVADHDLAYQENGAVLTEKCDNCGHEAKATAKLLLTAPIVYTGNVFANAYELEREADFIAQDVGCDLKKDGQDANEVKDAGEYTVTYEFACDKVAVLKFTVEKAEYTSIQWPTISDEVEAGTELKDVDLPNGFNWKTETDKVKYDENEYDVEFHDGDSNYKKASGKVTVKGKDTTNPTGKIQIADKTWIEELADVVFGWFIKDKENVIITAEDAGAGIEKIEYIISDAKIDDFTDIQWQDYADGLKIEVEGNNIVYAKITDKVGKTAIINSDGIVLDTAKPVIDGAENNGKYSETLTVTISDKNIKEVTVDGKAVELKDGKLTLTASDKAQVIKVTDKAGNETSYTVTVAPKAVVTEDTTTTDNTATDSTATSPVTGQTALAVVLFVMLLGALAVMSFAAVKSRKADNR